MKTKAQARRRHIPVRTCVVCRQALAKRALHRIVLVPERGLLVDLSGKMPGRGAYLCSRPTCWEKATAPKTEFLSRALRSFVSEEEKAALLDHWTKVLKPDHEQHDEAAR